jgi:hypothetical protein
MYVVCVKNCIAKFAGNNPEREQNPVPVSYISSSFFFLQQTVPKLLRFVLENCPVTIAFMPTNRELGNRIQR